MECSAWYLRLIVEPLMQVNTMCMWSFRDRGGAEDTRTMMGPELFCKRAMDAGVTDICFLDERNLVASLENGGVVMLQCSDSAKVGWCNLSHTSCYPLPFLFVPLTTLYL